MGYSNHKALCYLLKAAIGVEFTTKELNSMVYKRCKLTNTKEQIFRAPWERLILLFDLVSWDVLYIKNGIGGKKRILYTINNYTRIHFVYILYNNKLNSLIKYFKAITTYVFKQYSLII